jgi:hypothetical protein
LVIELDRLADARLDGAIGELLPGLVAAMDAIARRR